MPTAPPPNLTDHAGKYQEVKAEGDKMQASGRRSREGQLTLLNFIQAAGVAEGANGS